MARSWDASYDRAARNAAYRHAPSTHYDRQDLYQEAAVALLRRQPKDPSLAHVVAHGAVIDFLRKHGRHDRTGRDRGHHVDLADHHNTLIDPHTPLEVIEDRDEAVRLTSQLTRHEREVLWRHACGQYLREIGAALGLTETRVHQIRKAALEKVRREAA